MLSALPEGGAMMPPPPAGAAVDLGKRVFLFLSLLSFEVARLLGEVSRGRRCVSVFVGVDLVLCFLFYFCWRKLQVLLLFSSLHFVSFRRQWSQVCL